MDHWGAVLVVLVIWILSALMLVASQKAHRLEKENRELKELLADSYVAMQDKHLVPYDLMARVYKAATAEVAQARGKKK